MERSHHRCRRAPDPADRAGVGVITVFSKPRCPQCHATQRWLAQRGVQHVVRDVTVDTAARAQVLSLGYTAAPVVVVGDEHWSGFRPDRLRGLVTAAA
ncbi:MAG: glutaredoxin family protein [Microthrixaceae bacterium]|nr:glutaredoxin family protein [Microthrixaceae bacterium]